MSAEIATSPLLKLSRTPPVCLAPTATVREATRTMVEQSVGAVGVVDEGVLVGVFTEHDLMVKITDREVDGGRTTVGEVMNGSPVTIGPDARGRVALQQMITHGIRHLPVTDPDGRLLGMLSIRSLYRHQLRRLRGQLRSLEAYFGADGSGG